MDLLNGSYPPRQVQAERGLASTKTASQITKGCLLEPDRTLEFQRRVGGEIGQPDLYADLRKLDLGGPPTSSGQCVIHRSQVSSSPGIEHADGCVVVEAIIGV